METYQMVLFWLFAWMAAGCVVNVLFFPGVRLSRPNEPRRDRATASLVSILVPARNEEHNIRTCVASLKAQDDPCFELLVLDDRSEDATAAILAEEGFADGEKFPDARLRVISGKELPPNWAGKPWACHQLAGMARGDWLLFTDADTMHAPGALRAAVESAAREKAGLFSAWPRQITGTWSEKLVIPLLYVLTHFLLPQALVRLFLRWRWLARLAGSKALSTLGAANGQFMLFRRETYERIGGHAAVAGHLVEDVALGRLVMSRAAEGARLVNADGSKFVSCRMYRGFKELWEGFSKNLRPVFGTNLPAFLFSLTIQAGIFVAPFVFAMLPLPGQRWAAAQACILLAVRGVLALRFRTSALSVLLHPFAYVLALAIALNSWRWAAAGTIRWKGRAYKS